MHSNFENLARKARSTGVHGFISRADGTVLILKRSSTDKKEPGTWDIPGGGIKDNPVEEGFKREILEETGLDVSDITIVGAYNLNDTNLQLFALCSVLNENQQVSLSFEHSSFQWVSLDEIEQVTPKGLHLKAALSFLTGNLPVLTYPNY